ncbi:His-Xaa-Ser system radical SAM maturase HxsB [Novosphingobium profundi]|uniref:His-Xaa-Ser system radical SAM maturase HxsB n=1 Tax=Novosphingobium profundi TaxID=1774954 RepID=UPI001BD9EE18|nr:His-Xaa-Ser system radical SAM maturase HxsB [Novosphingobium profundi]MBT0671807.1 His-Xaa-Ser system radical SAM maturase HxsB [Novosphingobium profundi]
MKIEFQGGEPTLRCDLISAIIDAVPEDVEASFVICTNLQNVPPEAFELFDRADVSISTSLDGPSQHHAKQRGQDDTSNAAFERNLDSLLGRYGPGKISALPTLDPRSPPDQDDLIEAYAGRGLSAIYLRPINFQGFARKQHADAKRPDSSWLAYHEAFIRRLIERNWHDRSICLEESYFSLLLRRIFRAGEDRHIDLRNPNPFGSDFIVIDYDGLAYPTDEARMLARAGIIDLSIGDVERGWHTPERDALNAVSTCDGDPDCEACTYKPFCGRDIVDDISRYGTIQVPRQETEFCRRHLHLFDLAFELIHSPDPAIQFSLCRWLGIAGDRLPMGRWS